MADNWWSVDGTPTDCVYLAIHHVLKDRRPDVVVSGVNYGANLADDVTYSGTVAAAMEGALLGVPAIAVSLVSRDLFDFGPASRFAARLAVQRTVGPGALLAYAAHHGVRAGARRSDVEVRILALGLVAPSRV